VDSAAFDSVAGLTTVAIKGGIVAGPGGILYVQSSGTPKAVLEISPQGTPSVLSSGGPFQALSQFMTRASNGDVLVADESPDVIHRINPAGVGTFLSQAQLEAANGGAVTPRGGIAFDSAGNFYLAESNAGNLLRFDPSLNGTVWIPASVVVALTGVSPNFNGGIAFEPMPRTVLLANFANGNNSAFNSRVYLWNPSSSAGEVTVRVFTLPLAGGLAQELTATPLPLDTLGARSALNIKLAEDILTPLGVLLPYTIDGGNLTLEFTIQAADVRGAAQVFSSDFAFGTQPLQEIPATSSGSPTVLVANVTNGNSSVNDSRIYLWNPSTSAGELTVRVFTLPVADSAVQQLVISSITQANPAVVTTSTDHGLVTGDEIRITGVIGMTQVNDREFVITVVDADEFSLNGEDSTGHAAYVFGGVVSLMGSRPLVLGTLGARSALNIKLAEDILMPLGIALPYTRDDGNLTMEFTIQAADVKGAAQVFSSIFASGTYTLQAVPPVPIPGSTRLVAGFTNGNDTDFDSRISLFNPSSSGGDITVRVFTLPLSSGTAQELTITPLELGTLEARSALNIRLVEDILVPLEITTPYTTDGGNLILELTIQATDVQGTAQVFSSDFSLGTYPLQ